MKQIIVDLFSFDALGHHLSLRVYGYGLMLVAGFLVGIYLARWRARRSGEDPDVVTHCGMLALLGGIVGGRIAYVIQHWSAEFATAPRPWAAVLDVSSGGLTYHGGLILAAVMVVVYLLAKRLPVRRYLDIVAVSLLVGLAFGRVGCLLNGCCFGEQCSADWPAGMRFPMYSKPLVRLSGGPGGFSHDDQDASPVYMHQFSTGAVEPDERLFDRSPRRLWPLSSLHGRLERDQLDRLFDESAWKQGFGALAGDDGWIDKGEWQRAREAGDGLLRGSENWTEAVTHFDEDFDGALNFTEFSDYMRARRGWVLARFDANGDGELNASEYHAANEYLQADLYELAAATRSAAVKPAQPLAIIGALLMAGLLFVFYRMRRREGQVFALFLVAYPLMRFFLESLRDQNAHDLSHGVMTHNQITALALAAAGVVMLAGLQRMSPSAGPTMAQRLAAGKSKHGRRVAS